METGTIESRAKRKTCIYFCVDMRGFAHCSNHKVNGYHCHDICKFYDQGKDMKLSGRNGM